MSITPREHEAGMKGKKMTMLVRQKNAKRESKSTPRTSIATATTVPGSLRRWFNRLQHHIHPRRESCLARYLRFLERCHHLLLVWHHYLLARHHCFLARHHCFLARHHCLLARYHYLLARHHYLLARHHYLLARHHCSLDQRQRSRLRAGLGSQVCQPVGVLHGIRQHLQVETEGSCC
ncbi:hypothetical protein BKA57DRAFT_492270 [Linnemannia elongata]|nr:hypothetical protein BKA57DRAFT_492270 [Linnemannia elongata]